MPKHHVLTWREFKVPDIWSSITVCVSLVRTFLVRLNTQNSRLQEKQGAIISTIWLISAHQQTWIQHGRSSSKGTFPAGRHQTPGRPALPGRARLYNHVTWFHLTLHLPPHSYIYNVFYFLKSSDYWSEFRGLTAKKDCVCAGSGV